VLDALKEVKHAVASAYGRPRLKVHGSKHLTAAFAFGRVFARFELEVRQSPHEVWHTDAPVAPVAPFQVDLQEIDPRSPTLFLQMATGLKNIGAGIDALTASGVQRPGLRLNFVGNKVPPYIDNGVCRAMEEQVYSVLDRTLQTRSVNEIHLFAAAPQSLMMMLGRRFSGMPPVCLYEWDGTQYLQSCRIPGGVL
jgi:hypothetical protein